MDYTQNVSDVQFTHNIDNINFTHNLSGAVITQTVDRLTATAIKTSAYTTNGGELVKTNSVG